MLVKLHTRVEVAYSTWWFLILGEMIAMYVRGSTRHLPSKSSNYLAANNYTVNQTSGLNNKLLQRPRGLTLRPISQLTY